MTLRSLSIWVIPVFIFSVMAIADPKPPETIKHPDAKCVIETSGGEYPSYVVKKGNNIIYPPKSDGIIKASFSPSGKFIAFSGSEINWVDIGEESFSIVVLDCESEQKTGFRKEFSSCEKSIGMSLIDEKILKYVDTTTEKEIIVKIMFITEDSFELTEQTTTTK